MGCYKGFLGFPVALGPQSLCPSKLLGPVRGPIATVGKRGWCLAAVVKTEWEAWRGGCYG
jgi:hypothetical protein